MITDNLKEPENAIEELIKILSTFSQQEINKTPFKGSWTAAQVGDHLLKSYGLAEVLYGKVKATTRLPDQKTKAIDDVFLDFETKMKAPDFIIPSHNTIDKKQLLESLQNKNTKIHEAITSLDLTKTCTSFSLPGFGEFTRLEWIYFAFIHTQRHVHQLKNIRTIIKN